MIQQQRDEEIPVDWSTRRWKSWQWEESHISPSLVAFPASGIHLPLFINDISSYNLHLSNFFLFILLLAVRVTMLGCTKDQTLRDTKKCAMNSHLTSSCSCRFIEDAFATSFRYIYIYFTLEPYYIPFFYFVFCANNSLCDYSDMKR